MRTLPFLCISLLVTVSADGCSVAKGLYVALFHNSGAPSRNERVLLDQREVVFLRELPRRRLVILPLAVLTRVVRYDSAAALDIAEQLRDARLGSPITEMTPIRIPFEPQPNEAAIFWSRFKALADSVRLHPRSDADYVLLVDVFGDPDRRSVAAVHAMVVTAQGDMAYRGTWNSHQQLYKEFKPATLSDAARMVATDISRRSRSDK